MDVSDQRLIYREAAHKVLRIIDMASVHVEDHVDPETSLQSFRANVSLVNMAYINTNQCISGCHSSARQYVRLYYSPA